MGGRKVEYFIEDGKRKRRIIQTGGTPVFKCVLPGCRSYILMNTAEGAKCLCWECGKEMFLESYHLKTAKPKHQECRKVREF